MKLIAPDYYTKFKCIADKCKHSCCIGWVIDVDPDTLEYYHTMEGDLGERLKKGIDESGETAHFILGEGERCPFLNQSGLCDLITELGEESLCQICTDHPRYRNFYSDRTEIGLGLCCEAAGELILRRQEKTTLVVLEDDGENEELDVPDEYLDAIRQGMQGVVDPDGGGTASTYFSNFSYGDKIAAKTGTAEKTRIDLENNGWMVAFAPYENPEIAVVVYIPNGYGGSHCSPAIRDILEYYLDQRQIQTEDFMAPSNSLAY